MPEVNIRFPRNSFDPTDLVRYKREVSRIVAEHMDAIDPKTGEMSTFVDNPEGFIDLILDPYDPDNASLTTPFLGTIVSYAWPDRMENIGDRLQMIADAVTHITPKHLCRDETISFKFLPKQYEPSPAWAVNKVIDVESTDTDDVDDEADQNHTSPSTPRSQPLGRLGVS